MNQSKRNTLRTSKMKEIPLTKGNVTLVDDEDYDYLIRWKWQYTNWNDNEYARRTINLCNGHWQTVQMHRVIMNTPDNMECDHKDRNGLNNQKSNLRNCTHAQNMSNRRACGVSKYLGVKINKGYIIAFICSDHKQIYLGTFPTEEDAAQAYDVAALKYHGEFANLNFKQNV